MKVTRATVPTIVGPPLLKLLCFIHIMLSFCATYEKENLNLPLDATSMHRYWGFKRRNRASRRCPSARQGEAKALRQNYIYTKYIHTQTTHIYIYIYNTLISILECDIGRSCTLGLVDSVQGDHTKHKSHNIYANK